MTDLFASDRTRTTVTEVAADTPPERDRTRTIDDLVEHAGHLRNVTRLLSDDIAATSYEIEQLHHQAFEAQLDSMARNAAKRPAREMLEALARRGFAWRDVARMIGVSVPALRRWRQDEPPTGAHLLAIARLLSFTEILRTDHLIADVAAWMEIPLVPGAPLTGIDLACERRFIDLFDLAAGHESAESVLNRWRPSWSATVDSQFEVFTASDGELGLRLSRGGN